MSEFKVGDVVRALSGGPKMTVEGISLVMDGLTKCVWFDETGAVRRMSFYEDCLEKAED